MPAIVPVIAAVAASIAAEAAIGSVVVLTYTISAATVGMVVGMVVSVAAAMVMNALMAPKKQGTLAGTAQDRASLFRMSVSARPVIYGHCKVGGQMVFVGSSGADQRYLHVVALLADHPIQAVDAVWINDVYIPSSDWDGAGNVVGGTLAGLVRVRWYDGTQTAADADLVAECAGQWPSSAVGVGCAYLYVRLLADRDKFPSSLQNVAAEVRGKNTIVDPRTGTAGYTNNWALCVLDYLTSAHGMACGGDEIDESSFVAAANLSDEAVAMDAASTVFQPRYTLDGSFLLDAKRVDILTRMLTAGAGALTYVQGRHRLHGGAYVAPTDTLGPGDFAGTVQLVTGRPGREIYNALRGTFINPADNWQAAAFPAVYSDTYDAEDGERIWSSIELPFTTDPTRAQRIAMLMLKRSRDAMQIKAPVKYSALRFAVKDVVSVDMPDFGFVAKPMEVVGWTFDANTGSVSLVLEEVDAAAFSWAYGMAADQHVTPSSTLASPLAIPAPTGLVITATTALQPDGSLAPALLATCTAPAFPFIQSLEFQWRTSAVGGGSAGDWNSQSVDYSQPRAVLAPVVAGVGYDVRVRACTALYRGAWTAVGSETGAVDSTAPGVPSSLTVLGVLRGFSLRWIKATDSDLAVTEVWANDTGTWFQLGETAGNTYQRQGLVAGDTASFKVRSRDQSGNLSAFSSAVGPRTVPAAVTSDITPGAVTVTTTGVWAGAYAGSYTPAIGLWVGEVGYSGVLVISYTITGGNYDPYYHVLINFARVLVDGSHVSSFITTEGTKGMTVTATVAGGLHYVQMDVGAFVDAGAGYFGYFPTPEVAGASLAVTYIKR
jgi:Putative phage tail protein